MSADARKKNYRLIDLANQIQKETSPLYERSEEREAVRKLVKEFIAEVNKE